MGANGYRDYFKVLGVDRNASADVIKRAFRKLARQFHPDVNQGDKVAESKFKEISAAYEVLSDSEKRSNYDKFGLDASLGLMSSLTTGCANFTFSMVF